MAQLPMRTPGQYHQYSLELTNTGLSADVDGDLGIQIEINKSGSKLFGPSDYLGPGTKDNPTNKTYDSTSNISTKSIDGLSDLVVHWTTYKPTGDCPKTFNFTENMHVMVKVDSQGGVVCRIIPPK